MSKTLRTKVTLEPNEAYVVADLEFWEYMIELYESYIPTEGSEWQKAADFIREQVDNNLWLPAEEDWED